MTCVHFITHPQVTIDPAVPVPNWKLSPAGMRRMRLAADRPWLTGARAIFSSAERKARQAADMLGARLGISPTIMEDLGENDRSATGYLPKTEFEAMADWFFACPDEPKRARDGNALPMRSAGSLLLSNAPSPWPPLKVTSPSFRMGASAPCCSAI